MECSRSSGWDTCICKRSLLIVTVMVEIWEPFVACRERFHLRQWVVVADGDRAMLPGEVALKGFAAPTCMLYEVSSRPHVNTKAFSPLLKHPPRHHLSTPRVLISFSYHVLFNWRYRLQFQWHFLRKTYRIQLRRNAESVFIEFKSAILLWTPTWGPSRMPGVGGICTQIIQGESSIKATERCLTSQEQLILSWLGHH